MQNQARSESNPIKASVSLVLLAAVCFFAFSYRLGEIPPYHTDENFYILSAKNMVESGDYITPMYHDRKRFAKPIFFYWLVALSYKTLGVGLAAARLVSVILGTLSVCLTYLLGRRLFDRQAALAGAFLLPSFFMHFEISRWATTDMTLNFFILTAFYFFVRGYQDESEGAGNYYLFYLAMALGFLTKGPPAVLIPGLTLVLFLWTRREGARVKQMRLGTGILIMLAVILPWFAAMFVLHGNEFKNHLLGPEIRDRIIHGTPFSFYYPGVLFRYYLPWSLFLIFAFGAFLGLASLSPRPGRGVRSYFSNLGETFKGRTRGMFDRERGGVLLCLLWILIPLILFSLFRIEHSRYLLPGSSAMALLLGHFFVQLARSPRGFRRPLFKIPFYLTILLYFVLTVGTAAAVLVYHASGPVPFRIMFLPLFLASGTAVCILIFMMRRWVPLILALCLFQIVSLAFISGDAIPFFSRYPMKKFAEKIRLSGTGEERIGVYRLGSHQARLGVLTGQMSKYIFTPQGLKKFLDTDQKVFVVLSESDWRNNFRGLPLIPLVTDKIWRNRRVDRATLKRFWEEGVDLKSPAWTQTLILFTNR
ncbi:MAG: ArnT family glycosyltransferase [Nitrospinaceae bacterium]